MEEKQKTAGELRREALLYQPKNGYDRLSAQDEADMKSYCEAVSYTHLDVYKRQSHDRYFINRFATRIWMLENGQIIDFRGTFEEYRAAQERKRLQAAVLVKAEPEKPKKEKPRRPGGTKELEKQVAAAERAVAKAEERQYELTLKAEEVASNYLELQKVYDEQKALEEEIAALYTKWETLAAELEEARG